MASSAMASPGPMSPSFVGLIQQKERELHDITDFRLQALQASLAEKDAELQQLRDSSAKLREDFQYNMQLFEERDKELAEYDSKQQELLATCDRQEEELTSLRKALREAERARDDALRDSKAEIETARREAASAAREAEAAASHKSSAMQTEIQKLRLHVSQLQADVQKARAEAVDRARELSEVRDAKSEQAETLRRLQQEKSELETVKHSLLTDYETRMAEALGTLKSVQDAFAAEKAQFEDNMARFAREKEAEAREAVTRMQAKLLALDSRFRSSEEVLSTVQRELRTARQDYEEALSESRDRERDLQRKVISPLQLELSDSKRHVESLTHELAAARSELDETIGQLSSLKAELSRTRAEYTSLRSQRDGLEQSSQTTHAQLTLALAELDSAKHQLARLHSIEAESRSSSSDLISLRTRLSATEEDLRTTQRQLERTTADLNAAEAALAVLQPERVPPPRASPLKSSGGMVGLAAPASTTRLYSTQLLDQSRVAPRVSSRSPAPPTRGNPPPVPSARHLRSELDAASSNLQRLSEDRERLMQLSAQLESNLGRLVPQSGPSFVTPKRKSSRRRSPSPRLSETQRRINAAKAALDAAPPLTFPASHY